MKTRWYLLLIWFLMDSAFAEVAEPAQTGWIAAIFFLVSAGIAILLFRMLIRLAKRAKGKADGNDNHWSSASHDLDMNTTSDSTSHDNSFSGGGGDFGGGGASSD
ncbi:MAG: hypothetical protein PHI11_10860 [Gallionella sp.]|nr:hypothetical protein [Gallionella sp.]